MKNTLVYLADLRHNYLGVISTDAMPLGIGFMKAVMDRDLPEVESEVFAFPDELLEAIQQQVPQVLMLTNYVWNEALSLHFAQMIKQISPSTLTVVGGPNIPIETERQIEFLKNHPFIDLYVTGEGDFLATEIVRMFLESGLSIPKFLQNDIHSSVYLKGGDEYVSTLIKPRTKELDLIPSPFLTGVMDKFFDYNMAPLIETNRGCPFTCSFCVQGTKWYTKVNYFSLERIREEIFYLGKLIYERSPSQKFLRIADPNYGMYKRDVEISGYIAEIQAKYGYPLLIDATTGKNQAETIIQSLEKVNGALAMYQAVQSLDEDVLKNIKRKNIKLETYEEIQIYIRGRGLRSSSDLILGLPGESLTSHLKSMEKLINSGTHKLNNFQAMMLKGSELDKLEARTQYAFETKFRLLPKNFGLYGGEKVLNTEEIIVATDTLPFQDYLTGRKYHGVVAMFWNHSRFEKLVDFIHKLGFQKWDWIVAVVNTTEHIEGTASLLRDFLKETQEELFDSREEILDYFKDDENFNKLVNNEVGDNKIYKYMALASFTHWPAIVECAFAAAKQLVHRSEYYLGADSKALIDQLLTDFQKYIFHSYAYGRNPGQVIESVSDELNIDIKGWIAADMPLTLAPFVYDSAKKWEFSLPQENQSKFMDAVAIWDFDPKTFSMLIKRMHISWQERNATEISEKLILN